MASVEIDLEGAMYHLGEFGKYQAMQYFLHLLSALTASVHMLSLLTVSGVPPHRCDVNESLAIGNCHYLDSNTNLTLTCDSWIYDTSHFKSSRVMEWNMVCSRRWMGAVAQSAYMFGVFVGAVTLGSMADKYGRKIIFYSSGVLQLVFGVAVAFVNEYYTFLILRFFYGIFGSAGAYLTGFVLSMELIGPSKRTMCGILFHIGFAIGFMLVALWGYVIQDRFWLQIIYGLHSVVLLGHWWIMDESPRWLWTQGRFKEALQIIEKGIKKNGGDTKLNLKACAIKHARKDSQEEIRNYGVLDLFRTPNLRKKTVNVCFNWFANSIGYYGLSLATGNLNGNPYLLIFLKGLVDVPGYIFAMSMMDRTGRRNLISILMLIGGACCILSSSIGSTSISLFGKACLSSSFAIIYNYSAELFPTVLRNTALGIAAMSARLSGTLTPLIMLLDFFDPSVPVAFFGSLAILAGFLALFLPETLNQPLPETLEDGENFGSEDTCFKSCLKKNDSDGRETPEIA